MFGSTNCLTPKSFLFIIFREEKAANPHNFETETIKYRSLRLYMIIKISLLANRVTLI